MWVLFNMLHMVYEKNGNSHKFVVLVYDSRYILRLYDYKTKVQKLLHRATSDQYILLDNIFFPLGRTIVFKTYQSKRALIVSLS